MNVAGHTDKELKEKSSNQLTEYLQRWESGIRSTGADDILALADRILAENHEAFKDIEPARLFLNITGKSNFLTELSSREQRYSWAETACRVIRESSFSPRGLFESRMKEHPAKALFVDMSEEEPQSHTYEMIYSKIREVAAVFYEIANKGPIVALFCENSVDSASCDLACLFYDIIDTPLNSHFDYDEVHNIISQIGANIVITDSEPRYHLLVKVREQSDLSFNIFLINDEVQIESDKDFFLAKYCKKFDRRKIDNILNNRKRKQPDDIATVMFTSGSSGKPKGVAFSYYNLVSKRFARAAALPKVGNDEKMLCYLPLYHTFGRYLEMMGSIYWGATYIFAGNPSTETLFHRFRTLDPSGFISIPLRWAQLKEKCEEEMSKYDNEEKQKGALRSVIGKNLRWGLSAAGYLAPEVFRFFEKNGVELCSGFGMTEATGGITMTVPGQYKDNSVGIPLPCINTELNENNELLLSGDYVARYFTGFNEERDFSININDNIKMPTGDIFKVDSSGHYYIVDRLKDIYKNNKGQTIAPKKVENKFTGVPGIKRTFLVGDGREYNVLFIVPDYDDPVMNAAKTAEDKRDYFHRIVSSANEQLATYERVVNFSVLERDFSLDEGELTPKGSFRRKVINKNFAAEIDKLYISNYIELPVEDITLKIPRWFFRNLGILEDDIIFNEYGLLNKSNKKALRFTGLSGGHYIIGSLEYVLKEKVIDFSLLIRQPGLWAGNPELLNFYPCISRWDIKAESISGHVFLPKGQDKKYDKEDFASLLNIRDYRLTEINKLICEALFTDGDTALASLNSLGNIFDSADMRLKELIRSRLEALARHPSEESRCKAYRILLLEEPNLDYSKSFPAFVESGLSFLNNESINTIAKSKLGKRRLEFLRQRLFAYRTQLKWPAAPETCAQFASVLKLLVDFAKYNPEYYSSVRAELTSWILNRNAPELSEFATGLFREYYESFEQGLINSIRHLDKEEWKNKLIFEENISEDEIEKIYRLLLNTAFIEESITLAYDENNFKPQEIAEKGIWISKLDSGDASMKYRFSINMKGGKHFDLLVTVYNSREQEKTLYMAYWYSSVAGYPYYPRVLPRLGCCRPNLGAISTAYKSELTVWEKIRELSGTRTSSHRSFVNIWRKLYIRAIVAFLRGWKNSGYRIVPGYITPTNIVVPELDFHDGATIVSLSGYEECTKAMQIIRPIINNFYYKTTAHYPWSSSELEIEWIFDACIEAFEKKFAGEFFEKLLAELREKDMEYPPGKSVKATLEEYLAAKFKRYYFPLPLLNAVERYRSWVQVNQDATHAAKEDTINELFRLYRLRDYPEIARYYFYKMTFFANSGDAIQNAFDKLLGRMEKEPDMRAIRMIELSDLQNEISEDMDREVFSRMIFPDAERKQKVDVFKTGDDTDSQIGVKTYFRDKYNASYTIRRPVDPAEIGKLYRLFYIENYPKTVSDRDNYYLAIDAQDKIIGGICYVDLNNQEILLDGTVVVSTLKGRGIGTEMLLDFCRRMTGKGKKLIKTNYYLRNFYESIGFKVDNRWGAMVKILNE